MRNLIAGAALLCLATSAFADVLPSRRTAGDAAQTRVEHRLAQVGSDGSQVRDLAPADLHYFSDVSGRVQVVGHVDDFVWIGCCGTLACTLIWLILVAI